MSNNPLSLFENDNNYSLKINNIPSKKVIINRDKFLEILSQIETSKSVDKIRKEISDILEIINDYKKDKIGILNISHNGDTIYWDKKVLVDNLQQIINAHTHERSHYYIQRLKKSITEIKTNKINDLNLNRWKEYGDIITDSLWVLDKRDNSGAHNASYWGNFIPQIPNQFLRRYTKQNEWVLDPFLGSGTTLIECKRLGRNGIGIELQKEVVELAEKNISKESNPYNIQTHIINGDSSELNFKEELSKRNIISVQFLIMHPPYWDIIKFSNNEKDLSNSKNINDFLNLFGKIVDNTYEVLDKGRYFALVIGDKYSQGQWIPLGFYTMSEVLKRKYTLKSIIVKNFEETKGKMNQKDLWRYRALVGGFYIFKHEYIFLFQKK